MTPSASSSINMALTVHQRRRSSMGVAWTRISFAVGMIVSSARAFGTISNIVVAPRVPFARQHSTHSKSSRLFVIPGQGYDPNRGTGGGGRSGPGKDRRKKAYQNPYSPPPQKKRSTTSWSSSYVPTRPPSVAANAGDLAKNVDYLRQQSQEAAIAADILLEKSRQDLLRRSREASDRAESFLISSREAANRAAKARQERHFTETARFISTPFLAAALSFFLYPATSKGFHTVAVFCSRNNWVPVDGGNLQWSVLLPALNGVVMTAVSLLYANLISTTGSALRNRQNKIQESLRTEVSGVRGLAQLLPYYPDNGRAVFGTHIMAYIQQLVIELGPKSSERDLRTIIPPLLDYRDELHRTSLENVIHDNIRERSYEMLDRVAMGRQNRVTALQETFPPLHYGTITALSIAILFVFLIETDRPLILFLDSFQLRLIWGLLVGTITAIYAIGIDLNYPFVGTYTVPADRLLDESDEIMREIKGTFPDPELLEISSARNGEVLLMPGVEEVQPMTPPPPSPVTTYTDTVQIQNGAVEVTGDSSPDWSHMSVEEMNRRWIEGG